MPLTAFLPPLRFMSLLTETQTAIGVTSIGRWVLEKDVYNPLIGVANNQSKSFDVIEDLQQWKEVSVDCIVLSFYFLRSFFLTEITKVFQPRVITVYISS